MLLNKARELFSNPINVIDEEGNELTKSDIARRHLQSQRWAWVGAEEKNLQHNKRASIYEDVLKSKIDITNDLIDGGREDLLPNLKHLRERYDRFDEDNINAIFTLVKSTGVCKEDFLTSHLDLIKSLTKYDDFMYKRLMPYNKGVDRKNMPQIDDNEEKKKELGLKEERIGIGELRPFQKDIDQDKVTSFLASGYSIPTSWIISKDNYIMDGHHRWAATLEIYEPEEQVTVYRSDLGAEELHAKLMGIKKGVYVNNFENKKKGRVGQHYGGDGEQKEEVKFSQSQMDHMLFHARNNTSDYKKFHKIWKDLLDKVGLKIQFPKGKVAEIMMEDGTRMWHYGNDDDYEVVGDGAVSGWGDPVDTKAEAELARREDIQIVEKEGATADSNFKKWFGDSKVVNPDGSPMVVYHGTKEKFNEFRTDKIGWQSLMTQQGTGFYFTNRKEEAGSYGKTMAVYLSLQNPFILKSGGKEITLSQTIDLLSGGDYDYFYDEALPFQTNTKGQGLSKKVLIELYANKLHSSGDGDILRNVKRAYNEGSYDKLIGNMSSVLGVDGIIEQVTARTSVYVSFKSNQIKSATGNSGEFDANSKDITKADNFIDALKKIDEGLYKSFVSMPLEDFVKEHKELVDVLLHGTDLERAVEAKKQDSEIQQYFDKEEAKKLKHYAVAIYQRWEDGKILFLQRTFDDDFHPSVWNLPGGHIDAGETPEQAVKREFKEETNLEVDTCWGARVVTEDNAMIHYFWVIPKTESPIALLDSESQNYAFWDEYEFPMEATILNMESHLLAILHDEEIEKGVQLKIGGGIAGKAGYVQKKVLVNRKGSKPFWQNKWVKENLDKPKLPLKKTMSLVGMAKKVGVSGEVLTGILDEVESIMIDGNEYSFKYDGQEFNLVLTGIGEKKKGWHVVLKDSTKIEAKPKGEKKELDVAVAENIIKTAYKKSKPLDIQGDKYKIYMFSKTEDYVEFSINGGEKEKEPFKAFSQMLLTELKAKKDAIDKMKKYKVPDVALKDEDFEVVKQLGGSTGATLVKDKKGVLWVRKGGKNKGHRMEEYLAILLYKHLGSNVSTTTKLTKDYMYNKYIEGQSLAEWKQEKSAEEIQKMHDKISNDFVIDALLGNWDVVGLAEDNIVIDKSGVPIRIDVGGSLRYRAQGEKKKAIDWGASVGEIDTLKEMKSNPQSAKVFANISVGDIMQQVDDLPNEMPSWIEKPVRKVLDERLNWLKDQYEGMPTNLKDMGDLYDIPKDANDDTKAFYTKLNKVIEFTPVDQKIIHLMAMYGDSEAAIMADEVKATAEMSTHLDDKALDELNNKLGIENRELYVIREYTGNSFYRSINDGLRTLVGNEHNLVESGQVVKYKPEFEESAKKAFNKNNLLNAQLENIKDVVNIAASGVGTTAEGHYGVSNIQNLKELNVVLKNTVKKAPNEIELEIAKFYEGHAQGILDAYEKKGKYEKEIGVYIPSPELKEKYADVVDLSFASNPVNWEDIISKNKKGKGLADLKEWGDKQAIKTLLMGKLIARGLTKAERFSGDSQFVNKSKPISRKISPSDMNTFLDQHQKGNVVYWPNVSSCSSDFAIWSGNVHAKIMPKGALIVKGFSQHKGEAEHMLKPFPRMRVDGASEEGSKHHIKIQQIG